VVKGTGNHGDIVAIVEKLITDNSIDYKTIYDIRAFRLPLHQVLVAVLYSDDEVFRSKEDALTGTLTNIDYAHHEIHDGAYFEIDHRFDSVANNGYAHLLVKNGSTKDLHAIFKAGAGGEAELYITENPNIGANGTQETIYDQNRFTANSSTASAFHTPTLTTWGTTLSTPHIFGGGAGINKVGSSARGDSEWIMKAGEDYVLTAKNVSGAAIQIVLGAEWYEETAQT
jgi:hypothetical protein